MFQNHKESSTGGTYAAFTIGALTGAGIALLYARRSGRETRDLLAEKSEELGDAAHDAIKKGKKIVAGAGDRVASAVHAGTKAAHNLKAEVTGRH